MNATNAGLQDFEIEAADCITAIDPKDPLCRIGVWGMDVVAVGRTPSAGPYAIKGLEVEIDKAHPAQLQTLLQRVLMVKGYLPACARDLLQES